MNPSPLAGEGARRAVEGVLGKSPPSSFLWTHLILEGRSEDPSQVSLLSPEERIPTRGKKCEQDCVIEHSRYDCTGRTKTLRRITSYSSLLKSFCKECYSEVYTTQKFKYEEVLPGVLYRVAFKKGRRLKLEMSNKQLNSKPTSVHR